MAVTLKQGANHIKQKVLDGNCANFTFYLVDG
jgi:hypothetical protein